MPEPTRSPAAPAQGLVDLLDRVIDGGAVISGDLVIALAGVDLVRLDLRLLLIGVRTALEAGPDGYGPAPPARLAAEPPVTPVTPVRPATPATASSRWEGP